MKKKWRLITEFAKTNSYLFLATFLSGLLYNVLTLLIPISIGRFYEFNFGFSSHRLQIIKSVPFINTQDFTEFLIFFFCIVGIRFVFEYINKYLIALICEKFAKDLREKLFAHQLQVATEVYDQKGIGKYLLRYSGDLKSIQNYISRGLLRFLQDVFLIVILLVAIAYIDINLGLILSGSIIIFSLILFFINKLLYTISVKRRNKRSQILSFINTRLRGIHTIKAFNKYTPEEKRYRKRSGELLEIGKKYQKVASSIQALIPALTYAMLGILMTYVYYSKNAQNSTVDQSVLLILILLIISFLPIFRRILRVSIVWKLGNISFEKLIKILSLKAENSLEFQNLDVKDKQIVFKDITFIYPNSNRKVFENTSFTIEPRNTTVIIGNSGAGKSAFVGLLLKMYPPNEGNITYGKNTIDQLSEKSIRKNIAVVSKDFPLYGKDVYEAIVYSRKKHKKYKSVALLKDLQKFEHPKDVLTLDDRIGDLGNILTGSQKKILMYCRALLTNKPILLIDDPFKELNPDTENYIKSLLNGLKGKKTIIIMDKNPIDGLDTDSHYIIKEHGFIKQD
ncbi:MAG: ABC transporter ATP-binding protein [Allomuricauda sp.]